MNNTLSYKGLTAKIEFSADDNVFVGRVLGIDEIVVFHGSTVEELKSEMREMIDFYLETCEKKGKKPEKGYSGKILFRFPSELHAAIAQRAEILGKSVNEYGREVFENTLYKEELSRAEIQTPFSAAVETIRDITNQAAKHAKEYKAKVGKK
jgi:predicted HicB family RNase H-like nuclease